jgi:hypothetical protein
MKSIKENIEKLEELEAIIKSTAESADSISLGELYLRNNKKFYEAKSSTIGSDDSDFKTIVSAIDFDTQYVDQSFRYRYANNIFETAYKKWQNKGSPSEFTIAEFGIGNGDLLDLILNERNKFIESGDELKLKFVEALSINLYDFAKVLESVKSRIGDEKLQSLPIKFHEFDLSKDKMPQRLDLIYNNEVLNTQNFENFSIVQEGDIKKFYFSAVENIDGELILKKIELPERAVKLIDKIFEEDFSSMPQGDYSIQTGFIKALFKFREACDDLMLSDYYQHSIKAIGIIDVNTAEYLEKLPQILSDSHTNEEFYIKISNLKKDDGQQILFDSTIHGVLSTKLLENSELTYGFMDGKDKVSILRALVSKDYHETTKESEFFKAFDKDKLSKTLIHPIDQEKIKDILFKKISEHQEIKKEFMSDSSSSHARPSNQPQGSPRVHESLKASPETSQTKL